MIAHTLKTGCIQASIDKLSWILDNKDKLSTLDVYDHLSNVYYLLSNVICFESEDSLGPKYIEHFDPS